jgi:hypothetical protein
LVTSLFAIGLVPFIILMLAVGLRGLIGFRVEGRGIRTFRLRMDAVALSNALFLPQSRAGEVRDERQWLMEEIKRLESDDWPGLSALANLVYLRRRVFEVSTGLLALEVAWLVTVALIAPFID